MFIKKILADLIHSEKPIARVYQRNDTLQVIVLAFKSGMVLKEHKTPHQATLLIISGSVDFVQGDKKTTLTLYDEHPIPPNVVHSVLANSDSVCLLTVRS